MTLYVSDLDGTLLDREAQLSTVTRAGLTRLLDEGLSFTVASARHVSSIARILQGLPLRLPVISANGAYISEMLTGRHEMVNAMDPAIAQAIFALMRRRGFMPFASTNGPRGDRLFWQSVNNEAQLDFVEQRQKNGDPRLRHTEDLGAELVDPVVTMILVEREALLRELMAEIHQLIGEETIEMHLADDLYRPGWPWLTLHDRRATKDQAIRTLAQRYGLAEREIVVFGDQVNDIGMFRSAHRGIAMGNAIEDIKRQAHAVIGHHADDSVLRFIEDDWRR
ncbi:HAD family phosphatase [Roseateles sp. DAIF2]|uniref:HAD family hydrolase n=1 Tax=Roseateles sp. DAIF2 TaxID=2714952 RepID=UPI0018A32E21|nr:HAD family hydrolase [Roseateles sp. DAIF2]QPF74602.1 HAD family phosphatase [Roseateles sp. DAIF2]